MFGSEGQQTRDAREMWQETRAAPAAGEQVDRSPGQRGPCSWRKANPRDRFTPPPASGEPPLPAFSHHSTCMPREGEVRERASFPGPGSLPLPGQQPLPPGHHSQLPVRGIWNLSMFRWSEFFKRPQGDSPFYWLVNSLPPWSFP